MISLLVLATVAAQSALAPALPAAPSTQVSATTPEKPKLICVKQEVMGSLFPKRTCATEEQWKAIHQRDEDRKERIRDTLNTNPQ